MTIFELCIEEMCEICWRHFPDCNLITSLARACGAWGTFFKLFADDVSYKRVSLFRISLHVMWKNFQNFFNCGQVRRCWDQLFGWMQEGMLSSNQRIDLSDVWHHALSCWNNPLFGWRNKIRWTALSLKAGLTIFVKDVVDVVIRVNLKFLHNEMKIS